jgi:hypothetical protein
VVISGEFRLAQDPRVIVFRARIPAIILERNAGTLF